mmetsp:Transcript_14845/g.29964  ORF Transcript_14845/g.29964 Transcript_14845/m.29964 type:complete len:184 (+) Transcript_14845:253-804(+)
MRELKYHEQKLLKQVDYVNWKKDQNIREVKILKRYHIQDREDYTKYQKLCNLITRLTDHLRKLPPNDKDRIKMTEMLLDKLSSMGVIPLKKSLEETERLAASAFCRRRLAVMLVKLKFCEDIKQAVMLVEQGHVRVGPDIISDPAVHVTRDMEDNIGWAFGSSIRRKVREFNEQADDFELQGN